MKEILLGTWNYKVKEAPFGFRTGKAVFFEEDGQVKAKLKIYGLTIKTKDLAIRGRMVSFSAHVEPEQILITLEPEGQRLAGQVHTSEGPMSLVMEKKGSGKMSLPAETAESRELTERKISAKELAGKVEGADKIHTFYYGWYGNPEIDREYRAWNHSIVPHSIETAWNETPPHKGGDDVGANFYPSLGCYSSTDPRVIKTHMEQMRDAGIGVAALSWWGRDHFTDLSVPDILDAARSCGLKIVFHLEPFYSTVEEFRTQLEYISERYLQHPAVYRFTGLPFYYLYNSFKLDHSEWYGMLNPDSGTTLRNTALDGVFISLWTTRFDGEFTVKSGFDGFYTYFASDGFAYGSTTANWPHLSRFARENSLIYIPCVGPGYADTRIRPWNDKNTKNRDDGRYYEEMMKNAAVTNPDFIGITSFNEWHEGTQIEPAVPKVIPGYNYEDYGKDREPLFYIRKTKELVGRYVLTGQGE